MAYNDFSFAQLKHTFQISLYDDESLFAEIAPMEVAPTLYSLLTENVPLALAVDTEKARAEFIIAPVLSEYRRLFKHRISLFSGIEFTVDPAQGLSGICDFLISRSPEQFYISAPIIVLVEAKGNRIKNSLAQCIATMVAARLFNEQQGHPVQPMYGMVSTGSLWRFLKLEGRNVWIDLDEYHIREIGKIFAILVAIS